MSDRLAQLRASVADRHRVERLLGSGPGVGDGAVHKRSERSPLHWATGCLILALGLGSGSPTLVDPRYILFERAELPEAPSDKSIVYLVREQVVRARRLPYEHVYLDEAEAGLLPQRSWLLMVVEPGHHPISGIASCPDVRPDRQSSIRRDSIHRGQSVGQRRLSLSGGSANRVVCRCRGNRWRRNVQSHLLGSTGSV